MEPAPDIAARIKRGADTGYYPGRGWWSMKVLSYQYRDSYCKDDINTMTADGVAPFATRPSANMSLNMQYKRTLALLWCFNVQKWWTRYRLTSIENPITKIRRSHHRLIFIMEIAIPGKTGYWVLSLFQGYGGRERAYIATQGMHHRSLDCLLKRLFRRR